MDNLTEILKNKLTDMYIKNVYEAMEEYAKFWRVAFEEEQSRADKLRDQLSAKDKEIEELKAEIKTLSKFNGKVKTMAYDIHGNSLQPGHCEVHPWVHQTYPCLICYSENNGERQQQIDDREQKDDRYGGVEHLTSEINQLMKDKQELLEALKKSDKTFGLLNEIIESLKAAEITDLPELVNEIDIDIPLIQAKLNESLSKNNQSLL